MRFKENENGCWIFQGNVGGDGYGKISVKNVLFRAHRLMAYLTIKPIMSEVDIVAHSCDTPLCINPKHLFITTTQGNTADMVQKGRQAKGSRVNLSKLNEDKVRAIRLQHRNGASVYEIHKGYPEVSYQTVLNITRWKVWRHVH